MQTIGILVLVFVALGILAELAQAIDESSARRRKELALLESINAKLSQAQFDQMLNGTRPWPELGGDVAHTTKRED